MKIVVPIQFVPDLVEELLVDAGCASLDPDMIRWILNEFDDHAIEQAVILKERHGAQVSVIAPEFDGADDALYNAAARGVDGLLRVYGDLQGQLNTHALARIFLPVIQALHPDLVLTGVQAHSSTDGPLGPVLAEMLGMPYVGYVSQVDCDGPDLIVNKEYPGGLVARMQVKMPAVLGIQAAETPPRYVPIAKIRQAMKTSQVEEQEAPDVDLVGGLSVEKMYPPEPATQATLFEGNLDQVADQLAKIIREATTV